MSLLVVSIKTYLLRGRKSTRSRVQKCEQPTQLLRGCCTKICHQGGLVTAGEPHPRLWLDGAALQAKLGILMLRAAPPVWAAGSAAVRHRGARRQDEHRCSSQHKGAFHTLCANTRLYPSVPDTYSRATLGSSQSSDRLFPWCHLLQDVGCTKQHAATPLCDGTTFKALATECPQTGRGPPGQAPPAALTVPEGRQAQLRCR